VRWAMLVKGGIMLAWYVAELRLHVVNNARAHARADGLRRSGWHRTYVWSCDMAYETVGNSSRPGNALGVVKAVRARASKSRQALLVMLHLGQVSPSGGVGLTDRAMAFALGREPTFPPRLGRDPSTMLDFDDDEEAWFPFHVNPLNCPPALIGYVYQPKRRVAAFRYIARVCLVSTWHSAFRLDVPLARPV
jgi:hypothetical protein